MQKSTARNRKRGQGRRGQQKRERGKRVVRGRDGCGGGGGGGSHDERGHDQHPCVHHCEDNKQSIMPSPPLGEVPGCPRPARFRILARFGIPPAAPVYMHMVSLGIFALALHADR